MKKKVRKCLDHKRGVKTLAILLGLLCFGLSTIAPLEVIAAPIYMDDFEDGDLSGWLETIVPGPGGSGSMSVELHNGSQMAYVYHSGYGQHSLSQDFDYVADNILSFDMHAIAYAVSDYGQTLHGRAGVEVSFLNSLSAPLGSMGWVNATNPSSLGPTSIPIDNTQHSYTNSMSDLAAYAGVIDPDEISIISLEFFSTAAAYYSVRSSAQLWFDNVTIDPVPIPSAVWLFGSGLIGLVGLTRRNRKTG